MKNLLLICCFLLANSKLALCASKESKDVLRSLHRYSQLIEAITDDKGKGLFKPTPINELRLKNRSIIKSFLYEDHDEIANFILDGLLEWNFYETTNGEHQEFYPWACLVVDPKDHSQLKVGGVNRNLLMNSANAYKRANGCLYFPIRKSGNTGIFGSHEYVTNDLPKNMMLLLLDFKIRKDTVRYALQYEQLEGLDEAAELVADHSKEILEASNNFPKGYLSDSDQELFDESKNAFANAVQILKNNEG